MSLTGCGIGLRKEHFDVVLRERPAARWFEVVSENFMAGGRPRHVLEEVRRDYPVALHGVSLSPGSAEPFDRDYLDRLRALVAWVEPEIVSDHLCWTGVGGRNSHDLLPLPRTEEAGCLAALDAALDEADFLDDPHALLARLPADRVRQIHVAGHEEHGGVLIDTHDRPVRDEVWDLHAAAVRRCGPVPTLIEWDTHLPGFDVLLAVAARADEGAQRALREGGEVHATVE